MSKFLPPFPVLMHLPEKSVAIEEEKRGCLNWQFPPKKLKKCNFQIQFAQLGAYFLPTFY